VIFADGTWNSPEQSHPSHVLQMARGIKPLANSVEQVVFYDWGVGSDRKKISGGLSGDGIDKNIQDCYRFIVHNYMPGDQLFLFGFSRGAYTVRSLAGFIRNCGLLKREYANKIPNAYKLYRQRSGSSSPDADKAKRFRSDYAVANITPIEFVGAWDTVGSLGIPLPFWGTLGEREYLFHDTAPSKIIQHARHAVSIDENREDFEPTLWARKKGLDLQQVWFAGVHGDIGGGYKDAGLSYCTSDWMVKQAQYFGLQFEDKYLAKVKVKPGGKQHNERKGIYLMRKSVVREIEGPIHRSVKKRWDMNSHGYRSKSRALRKLLAVHEGDWSKLSMVD
jgi:uncharacterized protein (DUF2235 family)